MFWRIIWPPDIEPPGGYAESKFSHYWPLWVAIGISVMLTVWAFATLPDHPDCNPYRQVCPESPE